jgi:hypothetical protein
MTVWARPWLSHRVTPAVRLLHECQRRPGKELEILLHGAEERGVHLFVLVPFAARARRPSPLPQVIPESRERFPGPHHDVAADTGHGPVVRAGIQREAEAADGLAGVGRAELARPAVVGDPLMVKQSRPWPSAAVKGLSNNGTASDDSELKPPGLPSVAVRISKKCWRP